MLQKTWNRILNFGVSQNHPEENELIRLYNVMSILTTVGSSLNLLVAYLLDYSYYYIIVNSTILLLYLSVPCFNYFEKIFAARYTISIGSPIWIGFSCIMIGGEFNQGVATMACLAITYVSFKKTPKIRLGLLLFNVVIYLLATIYANSFGPIWMLINFPYDEVTVFIGGMGWAIAVLYKFNNDRNKLLEDLRLNNMELKDTTEELERFTYIASHDLKSPLRNIISFVGLIERDINKEDYSQISENLNFVKTGAEQMHFLVKDILELSKLKTQETSERSMIDLNKVLEKATRNLKEEMEEKGVALYCNKLPHIMGNELELVLLFQNFIQNGIKYNENPKPAISVSAEVQDKQIALIFKDNGIGIEKDYHEQIFQFFKRLHNSTKYQGTGLGLGLCKRIVNNYNGEINVDSRVGEGSTFTITLPVVFVPKIEKAIS